MEIVHDMAFRSNEKQDDGFQLAVEKLIGLSVEDSERESSKSVLTDLVERFGPVVQGYPIWHPLVSSHNERSAVFIPGPECGYEGLDHTIYLRDAIITCPYDPGARIFASVKKLAQRDALDGVAEISAEKIEAQFYHPKAHPILIKCKWSRRMNSDGTIPASVAVPLLLEKELPAWRWATLAENWKTMAPYLLGRPYGSRSSLFVNQEAGQAIKAIWTALIETGMYGPIKAGSAS